MNIAKNLEDIFQALGNKTRLEIVRTVLVQREVSCQELITSFPLAQPTMSHHFSLLLDSGVINVRKNGVRHFYRVNTKKLKELGINITKLLG